MRLVDKARLAFQEGTSDKVYEVDLCEVGEGEFVVNFRYGRRGQPLREGTKTKFPVREEKARQIFTELVDSKLKKGYEHTAEKDDAAEEEAADPGHAGLNARGSAVVAALGRTEDPRLNRWIWRAGELRLRGAEPALLALVTDDVDAMRGTCLAFALGRCGTQAALPKLESLQLMGEHTERMAREAQRALLDDAQREAFVQEQIGRLPSHLKEAATGGDFGDALVNHFRERLQGIPTQSPRSAWGGYQYNWRNWIKKNARALFESTEVLETLYLIDSPQVRPALLHQLRTAPVVPGYYLRMRRIFKAAEFRLDGEVYGILARRFAKAATGFWRPPGDWKRVNGNYVYVPKPGGVSGPTCTKALGRNTKSYLRRRAWRTLQRLGEVGDPSYVPMAMGILLAFSDADAQQPWVYGQRWKAVPIQYDAFTDYYAFNQILHRNSPRYAPMASLRFKCVPPFTPGGEVPTKREEAFPELWEQAPRSLWELLQKSTCQPVHEFAAKALAACPEFLATLEIEELIALLHSPYPMTCQLGLTAVQQTVPRHETPDELLLTLLDCALESARAEAWERLAAMRERVLADSQLIAAVVTSRYADTREYARAFLKDADLSEEAARVVVGRLMALLEGMQHAQTEVAADVVRTLSECFGALLRGVGMAVVRDLLKHSLPPLVALGGEILLARQEAGREIDLSVIPILIEGKHPLTRGVGVKLLSGLPLAQLREQTNLLCDLTGSEHEDLRAAARAAIARVISEQPSLVEALIHGLARALMFRKQREGVHQELLVLLRDTLADHLGELGQEQVWALLRSKVLQAQELGGLLLPRNVQPEELSIRKIVLLASHAILSVRQASWQLFEGSLDRVLADLRAAVAILDADWGDSREFAARMFRGPLQDHLTPEILVAICDSVRPDVQALGRELITARFTEEHGQEYLLKLSEHPTAELQTFATNYLTRFASSDPSKLQQLTPYFISVLCRVNKARVAKDRVLAFLETEALADEAAAKVVAPILARQSATMAISDRAVMIQAMRRIHAAFPDVELPVAVRPPEVRDAV